MVSLRFRIAVFISNPFARKTNQIDDAGQMRFQKPRGGGMERGGGRGFLMVSGISLARSQGNQSVPTIHRDRLVQRDRIAHREATNSKAATPG